MDVHDLAEQLRLGVPLPGLAVLIAYDVIESAAVAGEVGGPPLSALGRAADHLSEHRESHPELRARTGLVLELQRIARTGALPPTDRFEWLRSSVRDLVAAVPAEGSVPEDAAYVGF